MRFTIIASMFLIACSGSSAEVPNSDLFAENLPPKVQEPIASGNCNGSTINAGQNIDCSSGKTVVASEPKFEWTSSCFQQGSLTCDVYCKQLGKQCSNKCSRQSSNTKDASVQLACAHEKYGCNYLTLQGSILGADGCNQVIQPQGECSGEYPSPVLKCCCGE